MRANFWILMGAPRHGERAPFSRLAVRGIEIRMVVQEGANTFSFNSLIMCSAISVLRHTPFDVQEKLAVQIYFAA